MPVHPTAIVHGNAKVDSSAEVGPFCVIEENVSVGARCKLYQNVFLTGWTRIAEDCELHPGVVVGHSPQDTKYGGWRSYCSVGSGTILRENVTIHRGTEEDSETVVGDNCFFLAGSHVAHNCRVGNGVTLINNALLGGHVEVGDRATFGAAAMAHQFVRVGELAMLSANARVTRDILPFSMVNVNGKIAGLNRVGLKRAGVSIEESSDIREAYRHLFASGVSYSDAAATLPGVVKTSPGKRLADFVAGTSKRGVARRSRPRAKGRHIADIAD